MMHQSLSYTNGESWTHHPPFTAITQYPKSDPNDNTGGGGAIRLQNGRGRGLVEAPVNVEILRSNAG